MLPHSIRPVSSSHGASRMPRLSSHGSSTGQNSFTRNVRRQGPSTALRYKNERPDGASNDGEILPQTIEELSAIVQAGFTNVSRGQEDLRRGQEELRRGQKDTRRSIGRINRTLGHLCEDNVRSKKQLEPGVLLRDTVDFANLFSQVDGVVDAADASRLLADAICKKGIILEYILRLLYQLENETQPLVTAAELDPVATVLRSLMVPTAAPELTSDDATLLIQELSTLKETIVHNWKCTGGAHQERTMIDSSDDDLDTAAPSSNHFSISYINDISSFLSTFKHGSGITPHEHLQQSANSLAAGLLTVSVTTPTAVASNTTNTSIKDLEHTLRSSIQLDAHPKVELTTQDSPQGTTQNTTPRTLRITCHEIKASRAGLPKARQQLLLALRALEAAWHFTSANAACKAYKVELRGVVLIGMADSSLDKAAREPDVGGNVELFVEAA